MMYQHIEGAPAGLKILNELLTKSEGFNIQVPRKIYGILKNGMSFSDVAALKAVSADDQGSQAKVLAYLYAGG